MKISSEFERHLSEYKPGSMVQAVLLFTRPSGKTNFSRLERKAKREEIQEAIRASAAMVLPEIDKILARFGGRRLADSVDALGSLPVETTPDGIRALVDAAGVQAVLENQVVLPIH